MQTVTYYKLIRDCVPEIVRKSGYDCTTETMNEEEFRLALREKLIEEASEAARAEEKDLARELADVYEVMDAIMKQYNIDKESVYAAQVQRHAERGGFDQRVRLLSVSPLEQADEQQ